MDSAEPDPAIVNRQRSVPVAMAELRRFLARARTTLRLPAGAFTICLVTNSEIARWNRAYRGKPGPTDVLSFRADPTGDFKGARKAMLPSGSYLGDIAIAPAVARRNARSYGRTFNDEMRILILHGMLHLMGYDHEADTGQMDRREARLRRKLGLA